MAYEYLEDRAIVMERFEEQSTDYLLGYIVSYERNRSPFRRFLEDNLIVSEPSRIRAARKELAIKRRTKPVVR